MSRLPEVIRCPACNQLSYKITDSSLKGLPLFQCANCDHFGAVTEEDRRTVIEHAPVMSDIESDPNSVDFHEVMYKIELWKRKNKIRLRVFCSLLASSYYRSCDDMLGLACEMSDLIFDKEQATKP